jgi:ABC-type sugar transport system substrate-binding protein
VIFNGSVQDLNAKFQQAIAEKPTAIMFGGIPANQISAGLAQADKAGIITETTSIGDPVSLTGGYRAGVNPNSVYTVQGQINAYVLLRNSGCKDVDALVATLPAYASLTAAADGFTSVLTAHCPGCKVQVDNILASNLGSAAVTSSIVSAIESNPKIKYVYAQIGAIADGLQAAMAAAGITGVAVIGQVPDPQSFQALQEGKPGWWVNQSSVIDGWCELDVVLRSEETGKALTENCVPFGVVTPQNVTKGATQPNYPANYQQLFERLWHVGS